MLEIIVYIIVFILAWELPSYMAKKSMENKLKADFYAVLDKAVEYNVSSELILKILYLFVSKFDAPQIVSEKEINSKLSEEYKIEDIKNAVAFIQEHHLVNIKSKKKIQVNEKYFHLILFEKNKTKEIKLQEKPDISSVKFEVPKIVNAKTAKILALSLIPILVFCIIANDYGWLLLYFMFLIIIAFVIFAWKMICSINKELKTNSNVKLKKEEKYGIIIGIICLFLFIISNGDNTISDTNVSLCIQELEKNINYGYKNASFKPFSVCDENGSLPEMYISSAEVQNGFGMWRKMSFRCSIIPLKTPHPIYGNNKILITEIPQEELQMLNIFSQLPQEKKNDFCKNYK